MEQTYRIHESHCAMIPGPHGEDVYVIDKPPERPWESPLGSYPTAGVGTYTHLDEFWLRDDGWLIRVYRLVPQDATPVHGLPSGS